MKAYVRQETGGHFARPKWTVHFVRIRITRCGLPATGPRALDSAQGRPQGEIHICRRCFNDTERAEIEAQINPVEVP